ncbi:MAG: hypothetical protein L6Q37_04685 [Bdellovibrionaceae bacterium]|nr:hypothetical protein [Pseudobdellovibrionaceae bacterium]NUM59026.1 hypothetical protein [Pseudobdellovibrionaceae bacterium]
MNFDKLMPFILSVVVAVAAVGKIDDLQKWIWKAQAQAQVLHESRSSSWGNPKILKEINHSK